MRHTSAPIVRSSQVKYGRILPLVLAAFVPGCGGPTGIDVSAAEYGDRWPFELVRGTLRCDNDGARKYVTFDAGNGIWYALNGSAKSFGYPDAKAIQKPSTTGIHLQPFIERGLTLCW
jgi:hypothetical protein